MSKTAKVILGLIVVIVVLVVISSGKKNDTGPIKIGVIAPLTGDATVYGEAVKNGVTLAVGEINSAGGINGRMLQPIFEDGKCDGKDGASSAQKLVSIDSVKIIIGGTCSSETFGAAPITEPAKVILFSPVSSAAKITTLGDYVFRNHPSDNLAGTQLAKFMSDKYKKIAIVSENTEYAQGIRTTFTDAVKADGSEVVFDESYNSDVKDFRSIVLKLKNTGAEAIFICAQTGANASLLAKQIRDQGLDKIQFFTAYLTGPEFVKSNNAVNGTILIDVPGLGSGQKGTHLIEIYKKEFMKDMNYPFFVGTSYDATNIIADALKTDGLDTEKIKDSLYKVKNYEGSIGIYSLDSNGDLTGISLVFRQVKNGELVDLK